MSGLDCREGIAEVGVEDDLRRRARAATLHPASSRSLAPLEFRFRRRASFLLSLSRR